VIRSGAQAPAISCRRAVPEAAAARRPAFVLPAV